MKAIPKINKYMSTSPYTVGKTQTLAFAHKLQQEHKIRHLPVLDGGTLVGIITDRDLHLIETLKDVDPQKVTVEDAMTTDPYTVSPEANLDEVVAEMAEKKIGSAIVVDNHKVVGVFTTIDAMVAFSELLHSRLKLSPTGLDRESEGQRPSLSPLFVDRAETGGGQRGPPSCRLPPLAARAPRPRRLFPRGAW